MKAQPIVMLGVTGSIAAYKAAELVRLMVKEEWDVHVIMTRNATRFVGPVTFNTLSRNRVGVDMWGESGDWHPEHIDIADRADLAVIAPCTGNVVAKVANGIADDLLSSTVLAMNVPLVLAPAMNGKMWMHPATQDNISRVKSRGVQIVDPTTGDLACGYEGIGKLAEPEAILAHLRTLVANLSTTGEEAE